MAGPLVTRTSENRPATQPTEDPTIPCVITEAEASLPFAASDPVTVDYSTADGSATTADYDYTVASGQIHFQPGETSRPVTVIVNGDAFEESNETFSVNLSNAANAAIVLGTERRKPHEVDWRWAGALVYKNDVVEESGLGGAVLDHPATGVAWLRL